MRLEVRGIDPQPQRQASLGRQGCEVAVEDGHLAEQRVDEIAVA
jgi:hypothetical protein